MKKDQFKLGSIYISVTNPDKTIKQICKYAKDGDGGYICVSNLRMVRYAGKNKEYRDVMNHSLMNLPDGTPLTWCGRLWGLKGIAVTNGPRIFHNILSRGDQELKHFLLGDTQEVIDTITKKYTEEYNSNIVGSIALPFCKVEEFDYGGIADIIKNSDANIIWTAMRAPKQDQFNQILHKFLPNVVLIGVGRAFRISIGEVKDAPNWVYKLGIAGLFTRKVSLWAAFCWYFENAFFLLGYMMVIMGHKLIGRKYYE